MSAHGIRLTERDLTMFTFAAEHRLVLKRQLDALTGTDVADRMRVLVERDYFKAGEHLALPNYLIRNSGLRAIGSTLKEPKPKLDEYKHDIGAAWLWLAGCRGAFGPLEQMVSERRMRSHDGVLERAPDPYGIRLGGFDRYGNEALHYPDLLLIDGYGRRLALELELTPKSRGRLGRILGAYGTDARIDRVLYLVEDSAEGRRIGRGIASAVEDMGLSPLVYLRRIKPIRTSAKETESARSRARKPPSMRPPRRAHAELER